MSDSEYSLTQSVLIDVPGSDSMSAYFARPVAEELRGTVIIGMELFGVTAHVRDVCDRLAARGYAALAPDFYHRTAPGTELPANEYGRKRGFELLEQLTRQQALDDLTATIAWLAGQAAPLVGMVGLSVGGHLAYLAATHLDLPAAAIFYGGWIPTTDISVSRPEPTIADTAQIVGRVQIFVGSDDPIVPAEHRRQITDALTGAGVKHELIEYPGVGHGFLCDRRASYDPEAATDAWNRLLLFLDRG
jgi:carboxymethylenebutenolidase